MEREDEQQQEDAERISQVSRRREKFAVGKQDKCPDDTGQNEKKQLPAIVGLQRDKPLHHIVAVMIAGGEDAGDADGAEHKPDPHQGPIDTFRYSRVSLAHREESLWLEESLDRFGRFAGEPPPRPPLPPLLPPGPPGVPGPPGLPLLAPEDPPVLSFRRA